MRAVLQRVKGACLHVDGKLVSRIGPGVVALIGISTEDTMEEIGPLANKIVSLKMWNEGQKVSDIVTPPQYLPSAPPNEASSESTTTPAEAADAPAGRPWHSSLLSLPSTEILCVSQFTLYAHTAKGAKPDFHRSMKGPDAKKIYDALLLRIGELLGSADRVKDGVFGAMMDVSLTNDGPVTLIVDTADSRKAAKK